MANTPNLRVAVIGGGPGGYAAAFLAADLGMKVTLIDPEVNPGGVCLYRGCIPSKALLHVAKLIEEAEQAKNWGVEFAAPKVDLGKLRGWKESVVKKLTGGLGQLSKQRSVQFVQGKAAFVNSTTLKVTKTAAGGEENLTFDRIIIATGSRPIGDTQPESRQPAHDGLDQRARSAGHPEDAARHRRRLHRTGTGIGVRHARHEGDLR